MRFLAVVLRHTCRNMLLTWKSQFMTLFTVSLSVLIFSFFYLIYSNALHIGEELDDDLRLVVYLDEEPGAPLAGGIPAENLEIRPGGPHRIHQQ